jgi:hypothetical protein
MNIKEKCKEAVITILEIEQLYSEMPKAMIEHQGELLSKREVDKVIKSMANNDSDDYFVFINKVKRDLQELYKSVRECKK